MKSSKTLSPDIQDETGSFCRFTTLDLEPDMWRALDEICWREQSSMEDVCRAVEHIKTSNLSLLAAVRLFILDYFRLAATEEGHQRAGHGAQSLLSTLHHNPTYQ